MRPGALLSVADKQMMAGGGSRPQAVQFNLRADDWDELLASVEKVKAAMKANPGLADVDTTYRAGRPLLSVQVDRDRAAAVGIPAATVGRTLRAFLGQDAFATYREKGEQYDVKLQLPVAVRADPDAIGALTLRSPRGELVEVRSLARLVNGEGPSQIERQALKRQVTLLADLKGYSLGEAMAFLDGAARELPQGVQHDFEGQGKELGNTAREFLMAILLGVILIYMILAAQFESLLDPFTIMLSLPLSVIGAIAALLAAHEYMSMMAMIGMIMLAGLVTKNGILIVEFTNQLREDGRSAREALLEAGPLRLRPILMTTVAMIAGMIPVALARGDGAETRTGMAWAIIGGLAASTVLTLVVVPVVYALLDGLRRRHAAPPRRGGCADRAGGPRPGRLTAASGRAGCSRAPHAAARGARPPPPAAIFESALISMAIGLSPFRLKDAFTSWPAFSCAMRATLPSSSTLVFRSTWSVAMVASSRFSVMLSFDTLEIFPLMSKSLFESWSRCCSAASLSECWMFASWSPLLHLAGGVIDLARLVLGPLPGLVGAFPRVAGGRLAGLLGLLRGAAHPVVRVRGPGEQERGQHRQFPHDHPLGVRMPALGRS